MNTLAIGRRRERNVGDWLVENGYVTEYWQPSQGKFGPNDILGLFDLFGYTHNGYPYLVQIAKRGHHVERMAKCEKFMKETGMSGYIYWMVVAYKVKKRTITELAIYGAGNLTDPEIWKVQIPDKALPSAR